MKNRFVLFLFALCFSALGFTQSTANARYSESLPSISSTTITPYLVANIPPNSLVLSVCHAPANQGPNIACTNYAQTYNSLGAPCPNGAQDTPDPQPSACQSTADAQGNIAFYAAPGTYDWTACVQNTTTCFGPYRITLAISDQEGECAMTGGQCPLQTLPLIYINRPICVVTWIGQGTLTGILSSQVTYTGREVLPTLQPKSSVNSDTAIVDWKCQGNPN